MKRAYSIPVTTFKIGDVSGSDLAVIAVKHVVWPNRVDRRRPSPTLGPRDVLRGDGDIRLPAQSPRRVDRVGTLKSSPWHRKAIFPAIWPSGIMSSTPSP